MKKYIIVFLLLTASILCEDYYRNVIPGMPCAPGKRIGGVWEKTEPKCDHDLSQLDMLKKESRENARNWRLISFASAILASISVLVWYVFHIPQAGGVAVLSLLWSLFSTFMAVLVTTIWMVVLAVGVVVIIGLGIYLHKKCAWKWFKARKEAKNGILREEGVQGPVSDGREDKTTGEDPVHNKE